MRRHTAAALAVALLTLVAAGRAEAKRPATPSGADFVADATLMLRVVACAGDAEVPADWAKVVADHCATLDKAIARFRSRYVDQAQPFLAPLRPAGLPTTVVYPFGGGDLASALITYPDAGEITTISLEHAGDPTRVRGLTAKELKKALGYFRSAVGGLLTNHDSASSNMRKLERGPIPGQLSFFLVAASILGYQPVSLRFFRVETDGTLHYYEQTEIDELGATIATKKKGDWVDTDYSVAYTNSELILQTASGGHRVVHRHLAANLEDRAFVGSGLEQHLQQKGTIAAMTKAASYLLWSDRFLAIRDYLVANASFMISDSTGIPPAIAKQAGLEQTTYGRYTGPFLEGESVKISDAFRKLWRSQPRRKLPFRYGYPDVSGNYHMLITQRPSATAGATP